MNQNCPCPKMKCSHHGICKECREKHSNSHPYCERTAEEQARLNHAGKKALAIILPIIGATVLICVLLMYLLIK